MRTKQMFVPKFEGTVTWDTQFGMLLVVEPFRRTSWLRPDGHPTSTQPTTG